MMDAVEFLNEGTRMCNSYEACVGYPMEQTDDCCMVRMNLKQMIKIVEQWSKEHPVKTRQSEFLKQWPDAEIGNDGYPSVAPCQLYKDIEEKDENGVCCKNCGCAECRHDFWLKEIE